MLKIMPALFANAYHWRR